MVGWCAPSTLDARSTICEPLVLHVHPYIPCFVVLKKYVASHTEHNAITLRERRESAGLLEGNCLQP